MFSFKYLSLISFRGGAVIIKSPEPGSSPGYYERGPPATFIGKQKKKKNQKKSLAVWFPAYFMVYLPGNLKS